MMTEKERRYYGCLHSMVAVTFVAVIMLTAIILIALTLFTPAQAAPAVGVACVYMPILER